MSLWCCGLQPWSTPSAAKYRHCLEVESAVAGLVAMVAVVAAAGVAGWSTSGRPPRPIWRRLRRRKPERSALYEFCCQCSFFGVQSRDFQCSFSVSILGSRTVNRGLGLRHLMPTEPGGITLYIIGAGLEVAGLFSTPASAIRPWQLLERPQGSCRVLWLRS